MVAWPPEFLSVDDVKEAHAAALDRWGGTAGVRDKGQLEAAVMQAQAGTFDGKYYVEDVFSMAATYAVHISESQAFLDGNKRAGVLAAIIFLDLNGFRIHHHDDILYLATIEVAEKKMTKWQLAALLRQLAT